MKNNCLFYRFVVHKNDKPTIQIETPEGYETILAHHKDCLQPMLNIFSKDGKWIGTFNNHLDKAVNNQLIEVDNPIDFLSKSNIDWDFDNCPWIKVFFENFDRTEVALAMDHLRDQVIAKNGGMNIFRANQEVKNMLFKAKRSIEVKKI